MPAATTPTTQSRAQPGASLHTLTRAEVILTPPTAAFRALACAAPPYRRRPRPVARLDARLGLAQNSGRVGSIRAADGGSRVSVFLPHLWSDTLRAPPQR